MKLTKTLRVILGIIAVISLIGGNIAYAKEVEFNNVDYTRTENIRVFTEQGSVKFDTSPTIIDGRTLVPMRAIFEEFGLEVNWNNETREVTGSNDKEKVKFTIDSNKVIVNDKEKTLDIPAMIIEGRTMIPLRFLSEALGYNVVWEGDSNLILISKNDIVQWKYIGNNEKDSKLEYHVKYLNGESTQTVIASKKDIVQAPPSRGGVIIRGEDTDGEIIKEDLFKIYLSPSNQPANLYVVGDTNEKIQMEDLAIRIKAILDREYKTETIIGNIWGDSAYGREIEAKVLDADIYVAIHSNASSNVMSKGSVGFYHPFQMTSRSLTENIINELNKISPAKSSPYYKVEDGMAVFDKFGYGEIRKPANLGLTVTLIETDFHTNPETATWIINNKDIIARAYVNGIVETFNLDRK